LRTCALVSLGCPKNLVDSEVMLGFLKEKGWQVTTDETRADVLIVNTCAFLSDAIDESVATLRDVLRLKEQANCKAVIATGCLPTRDLSLLRQSVPGVDGFVGVDDIPRIAEVVEDAMRGVESVAVNGAGYVYESTTPRLLATPPWTAYVKIAEGCDRACSFCVIPQIRGVFRSRSMESIVEEARNLAEKNVREIVLISQDSTRYGMDLYRKRNVDELLARLADVEALDWIRLLYCYPTHVSDALIETVAGHHHICNYFDIPLQHAHPDILRLMKRAGSAESYRALIARIRSSIPQAVFRSAFIVGFPGETEDHFRYLLDFVQEMKFDRLAAFRYSPERGTLSFEFPDQVPAEVTEGRFHELMSVQQSISLAKNSSKVGHRLSVLLEELRDVPAHGGNGKPPKRKSPRKYRLGVGRTEGDAPDIDASVYVHNCRSQPGDMIDVEITETHEYDLEGRQV